MTIHHTTNYGIAWADDLLPLRQVAAVTQQAAETIDAALGRGGIAPPDATTQAELAARITALEALRVPQILEDTPAAVTATSGGAEVTAHPSRAVNPATLFGAGIGAEVRITVSMLMNSTSGTAIGNADFSLYRSLNGAAETLLLLDSNQFINRYTGKLNFIDKLPAGSTATYRTGLKANATGTNITTVAGTSTAAWNRARYDVVPRVW